MSAWAFIYMLTMTNVGWVVHGRDTYHLSYNGLNTPLSYLTRLSSSLLFNYFVELLTEYLMQFDSDSE